MQKTHEVTTEASLAIIRKNGRQRFPTDVHLTPLHLRLIEICLSEFIMMLARFQNAAAVVGTILMLTGAGLMAASLPCSAGEQSEAADPAWAFTPLQHVSVPEITRNNSPDDWSQTPVDRFILHELVLQGLEPAPPADCETLIRRLYFDLIGLPPTPDDVDAFFRDAASFGDQPAESDSPVKHQPVVGSDAFLAAWSRLVDRLLEDPRYGEHWARFWLDLVRYAESDGWNQDAWRPHIWRYRDYVIRSFNSDKPWATFVREQLSGDEMLLIGKSQQDEGARPDRLTALGFLRLGIYEYNQRDARGHWNDIMNETTDVVGDVFLGVSISCARCHDHKFDPILEEDYFRLRAFFEPLVWRDDQNAFTDQERIGYEKQLQVWLDATREVRTRLEAFEKPWHDRKWVSTVDKFPDDIQQCFRRSVTEKSSLDHQLSYLVSRQFLEEGGGPLKAIPKADQEKHAAMLKELAAFDNLRPEPLPVLMTVSEIPGAAVHPTIIPDDPEQKSIEPGFLSVLQSFSQESFKSDSMELAESSGRRTRLADWIVHPGNPLTNRVIVNRIWQQHFGRGLVATPNDFGSAGGPPSSPKLLDWMALQFSETGGHFKEMHRLILNSRTWMQSSDHPDAAAQLLKDPEERFCWRSRIRRLRAEEIRDSMLSVSNELQSVHGGVSVDSEAARRSIYLRVFRNVPDELLGNFDTANGLQSCPERTSTTTPVQALFMLNSEFTQRRAESLATFVRLRFLNDQFSDRHVDRQIRNHGNSSASENNARVLVRNLCRRVYGRYPNSTQIDLILRNCESWERTDAQQSSADHQGALGGSEAGHETEGDRLVDLCHVLLNSSEFLYID